MKAIVLSVAMTGLAVAGCAERQEMTGWMSMLTEVKRSPWNSEHSNGEVLTTRHYQIYTTSKNRMLTRYVPGFMEAAHQDYLRLTGLSDRASVKPMPIYIMASRREWVLLTKSVIRAHREAYLSIEAGGYCYKGVCVFWDLGGLRTLRVAAHEGLHQFLHNRMKDRLPVWVEEGLCVSTEGHRIDGERVLFTPDTNPFRFSNLRAAILQEHWKPIRKLLPMDAADVTVRSTERAVAYYAQLWALSMMIRSHPVYREGLKRMIADAEGGHLYRALNLSAVALKKLRRLGRGYNRAIAEPVFRHYITDDLDAFDREFLAFGKKAAGLE